MTWEEVLAPIKETEYFKTLWENVTYEYSVNKCFPPKNQIFRALKVTPFDVIKVVIIGQDPYHNDGQANGLSFSVAEGVKAPPSLKNIFLELKSDLGIERSRTDLEDWGKQGVLMLNVSLTVKAHEPNSHKYLDWSRFTDFIIQQISDRGEHVVFVLWGAFAQKKAALINPAKHFILTSAHPSPFSVHRGFFGSQPFSRINQYLEQHSKSSINW